MLESNYGPTEREVMLEKNQKGSLENTPSEVLQDQISKRKANTPTKIMKAFELTDRDIDRIVEMAWEDRTPFDQITTQFGLSEAQVIRMMRHQMKSSSFRMWRARVQNRSTKHLAKRGYGEGTFKCSRQGHINNNKISKR